MKAYLVLTLTIATQLIVSGSSDHDRKVRKRNLQSSGISGLTLYKALENSVWTSNAIGPLTNGMTYDLSNTGTLLSVVPTVSTDINRCLFKYGSGYKFNDTTANPFSMNGDRSTNIGGKTFRILTPVFELNTRGSKTLTVECYGGPESALLGSITVAFTVTYTRTLPPSSSNLPFQEQNGLVIMEAESVPPGTNWFYEKDLLGHTGTGYYRFDGNTVQGGNENGPMTYKVRIQNPGTYQLIIRSNKNHPDTTWSNDCYVIFNGDAKKVYANGQRYRWNNDTTMEVKLHTPGKALYDLSTVGEYSFTIAGRSMGYHYDRLILFRTSQYDTVLASNITLPESPRVGVTSPISAPVHIPVRPPTRTPARAPTRAPTRTPVAPVPVPVPAPVPVPTPVAVPVPTPVAVPIAPANGLYLVNAATDTVHYSLGPIGLSGYVSSKTIVGSSLNIVAITGPTITSVKFKWGNASRTESGKPFAMGGDFSGDYADTPYLGNLGDKTVILEQYAGSTLVSTTTYNFKIIA